MDLTGFLLFVLFDEPVNAISRFHGERGEVGMFVHLIVKHPGYVLKELDLPEESSAGPAHHEMQPHAHALPEGEVLVQGHGDQAGDFLAAEHYALPFTLNQFSSMQVLRRRRARCIMTQRFVGVRSRTLHTSSVETSSISLKWNTRARRSGSPAMQS